MILLTASGSGWRGGHQRRGRLLFQHRLQLLDLFFQLFDPGLGVIDRRLGLLGASQTPDEQQGR